MATKQVIMLPNIDSFSMYEYAYEYNVSQQITEGRIL